MSQKSVKKEKKFTITYDCVDNRKQTLTVSHEQYNTDHILRLLIIKQECLWCGFKSEFEPDIVREFSNILSIIKN